MFFSYLPASSPERLVLASTCMMAVSEGVLTGPPTCSTAAKAGLAHPPHAGFVSTGEAAGPLMVSASGTEEASFFLSFCESLGNFFIGVSGLAGALVVTAAEGSVGVVGVWAEGCSAARMALKKDLSLEEICFKTVQFLFLKQSTVLVPNFGKRCRKNVHHILKRPTYVISKTYLSGLSFV
jgi:hypothetical protein